MNKYTSAYAKKVRRLKERKPGDIVKNIAIHLNSERKEELSEDSKLRMELQELIKKLAKNGYSVIEIVRKLNSMDKFSKFESYFVGYAENHVNKVNREKNFKKSAERYKE